MALPVTGKVASHIAARSLFIKVRPTPANLTERRAVLRTLQSFGEIEVFKRLRDQSAFLVVAGAPETARQLISQGRGGVLQIDCQTVPFGSDPPAAGFGTPARVSEPVQVYERASRLTDEDLMRSPLEPARSLEISVFGSHDTKVEQIVAESPLRGPWVKAVGRDTFVSSALRPRVPDGPGREALIDWHSCRQLSDDGRVAGVAIRLRDEKRSKIMARNLDKMPSIMKMGLAGLAGLEKPTAPQDAEPVPLQDAESVPPQGVEAVLRETAGGVATDAKGEMSRSALVDDDILEGYR